MAEIKMDQVAQMIGVTPSSIYGEFGYTLAQVCGSNRVNPFSRFRPIRGGGINPSKGYIGLVSANDISVPEISFVGAYPGRDWTYLRPNGSDDAPYRLNDFDGYNGAAQAPIGTGLTEDISVNLAFPAQSSVTFSTSVIQGGESNIGIDDIHDVSNLYYAIALITDEVTPLRNGVVYTPMSTVGEGGSSVTIDFSTFDNPYGIVGVFAFLSPLRSASGQFDLADVIMNGGGRYLSLARGENDYVSCSVIYDNYVNYEMIGISASGTTPIGWPSGLFQAGGLQMVRVKFTNEGEETFRIWGTSLLFRSRSYWGTIEDVQGIMVNDNGKKIDAVSISPGGTEYANIQAGFFSTYQGVVWDLPPEPEGYPTDIINSYIGMEKGGIIVDTAPSFQVQAVNPYIQN